MDHTVVATTADRAAAAGLVAVRIDFGGVRESEGDVADRGAHVEDLLTAHAAALAEAPGLPSFGAGYSYGARLWLETLRLFSPPRVAGLLLLAPPTRIPKTSRDFGDLLLGRPIREASLDPTALEGLASLSVPTRVLVGSRDSVAPSEEISRHASPATTVTVLPDLNHFFCRSLAAGETAYDLLIPALDEALRSLLASASPTGVG